MSYSIETQTKLRELHESIREFDKYYQFRVQLKPGDSVEFTAVALVDVNKLHAKITGILAELVVLDAQPQTLFGDSVEQINTKAIKG